MPKVQVRLTGTFFAPRLSVNINPCNGGSAHGFRVSANFLVVAAAVLGAALKLYCAATTYGSCDVPIHARFGHVIDAMGIDYLYRLDPQFNHTPVTGYLFALLYRLAVHMTPPAPHTLPASFPFLLRLPSIIADFLSVLLLLRFRHKTGVPPFWAIAVYALSPVAFMVSGFHGNVDPIMACALVAAAYFCVEEHALLNGLLLGLACSVKIIPLMLAPVFLFFWWHRGGRRTAQFFFAFLVACLGGWSGALVESSGYFIKNVLGYNSFAGGWGITYWLHRFGVFGSDLTGTAPTRLFALIVLLKLLIVVSVVMLSWFRRKESGQGLLTTVALAWTCFAIFAPGFIPYYLVWMAPFILLYSMWWYFAVTTAGTFYLFVYYNSMSHGMPWNASDPAVAPVWNDWGVTAWLVFVALAASYLALHARRSIVAVSPRARKAVTVCDPLAPENISY